jgi:hypothetical protein
MCVELPFGPISVPLNALTIDAPNARRNTCRTSCNVSVTAVRFSGEFGNASLPLAKLRDITFHTSFNPPLFLPTDRHIEEVQNNRSVSVTVRCEAPTISERTRSMSSTHAMGDQRVHKLHLRVRTRCLAQQVN